MIESDDIDAIREQKLEELRGRAGDGSPSTQSLGSPTEPIHVDSKAELTQLAATHRVVLTDFFADWCGPCKLLDPTVREVARNTSAAVAKVDVDALPRLSQELGVQGVPSLLLYVDGEPVERMVGVRDYGTLESLIERYAA